MFRILRVGGLLCLVTGVVLVVVFLVRRPDPPEKIPYKDTAVTFFDSPTSSCPDGLAIDTRTGGPMSCTNAWTQDSAKAETLNADELRKIMALAQQLKQQSGSITGEGRRQIVVLTNELDKTHRQAYDNSGGRFAEPKPQPPEALWIVGGSFIVVAIGLAYVRR
jgi:hypothetical protein